MNIVTEKKRQRSASRPGPKIFKAGFFLILFLFFTLALGRVEAGAYDTGTAFGGTPTIVNNGPGNQTDPHLDGDLVAYTNHAGGASEIRYFNFATSVDLGISGAPGALDFLSNVSGTTVVFTRIEGAKQSIWSFDTTTAGPGIELAPSPTSLRRGASIGGRTVAWQELGFSTGTSVISEVVAYDLTIGTALRITEDAQIDRDMSVAHSGNVIAWAKCATAVSPCDIWQAVKGTTGWTVSQVTATADPESSPDTNGTLVVYSGVRTASATSADIYWTPVAGGAESQLALAGEQRNPNISGNIIAFEGRDLADALPNWDIYLYDLSASTLYRLTDTPTLSETLNDISVMGTQVRVVWSVLETDQNVYGYTFTIPVANAGPDQSIHMGNVVTLDGSGSTDPSNNYPLTYSWAITSKPAGSGATLSDPAAVNPSFMVYYAGEYVVTLVVTNSLGVASAPASITVSTTNTAPVADAGPDQSITLIGSTVQLDGAQSYDIDGDKIIWSWSFTQKPAGSNATIIDSSTTTLHGTASFVADVAGTYVVELVVSDAWASSAPANVTISFTNVKPVADAGGNQSVSVGDTVVLSGSASQDANGDPLAYSWSFVSVPAGSAATITSPLTSMASFVADVAGTFVASLVVNDALVNSDPSNATVVATARRDSVIQVLKESIYTINHLATGSLKNDNMANTLTNKINAAIQMIDQGLYRDALDKFTNDILGKTDGCAITGSPDKNDWITDCASQGQVYPLIIEAINLVRLL